ncbi:MAG TPA: ABC transporter permease [Jatrophihabitans sp.]|uniref:ABC transporter permease n=1 Tax=Jatrophihabitans sp. TaxID=1932789 RepID=UPI002EE281BB
MTSAIPAGVDPARDEPVDELIARYQLRRAGARPGIVDYTRELWGRRHFIVAFSTANNAVGYSASFLGQAWQLLTPLLNAAVYYLIFGVLLHTKRGVHNYVAFLVIGIFIFTFTQSSLLGGSRAISANVGLTRVLHFPRAVLPVSSTLVALQRLVYSLVVMLPIVLITGERPRWQWLLLIPAIALQLMFCLGLAFFIARIGAKVPDTSQLLPFLIRTWLYVSGVFYSIQAFAADHPRWVKVILEVNPGAVYVEVVRAALIDEPRGHHLWLLAVAWAVVVLAAGYLFFWQAEEQYGRV